MEVSLTNRVKKLKITKRIENDIACVWFYVLQPPNAVWRRKTFVTFPSNDIEICFHWHSKHTQCVWFHGGKYQNWFCLLSNVVLVQIEIFDYYHAKSILLWNRLSSTLLSLFFDFFFLSSAYTIAMEANVWLFDKWKSKKKIQ